MSLCLFSALVIFSRGFMTFFIGGMSNFVCLMFFLFPALFILKSGKIYKDDVNVLYLTILLYILYHIALIPYADSVFRGLIGLFLVLFYFILYFVIVHIFSPTVRFFKDLDTILLGSFLFISFFALIEVITDFPLTSLQVYLTPVDTRSFFPSFRINGPIGASLPFGVVMGYFSIYTYSRFVYNKNALNFSYFIFATYLVFATFSRGSLGIMILGYVVVSLRKETIINNSNAKLIKTTVTLVALIIFSAAIFLILPESSTGRILAIFNWQTEGSNLKRVAHWISTLKAIDTPEKLVFGVSLGTSGSVLQYFGLKTLLGKWAITESYYLKLLVEGGVISIILFLAILGSAFILSIKSTVKYNLPEEASIRSFLFAALFSHAIELFFLQSLESTSVAFMFFLTLGAIHKINTIDKLHACPQPQNTISSKG